jgi:hypothetical protein
MDKKINFGQFFTQKDIWLKPQIKDFIISSGKAIAFDPFAGGGDLLRVSETLGLKTKGMDIDESLSWEINDGLKVIPHIENTIIITNPPYLYKSSAKKNKAPQKTLDYFKGTPLVDLYLIALKNMTDSADYVVAIIPETFIKAKFPYKNRLHSITILEENPFTDTDTPVCVACFDNKNKEFSKIPIYKGIEYSGTLDILIKYEKTTNQPKIKFNDKKGWLGLRGVDSQIKKRINFDFKENIDYDWENKIKVSSRALSLISVDVPEDKKKSFIEASNAILNKIREETNDVILTPFKGNTKNQKRRRRLDFKLARSILETAYKEVVLQDKQKTKQTKLF